MNWMLVNSKEWGHLERTFSWVADMNGVPQDERHHAEGDVAVHTQMVLKEIQSISSGYDVIRQEILWAAALLHDVEKRSTTVVEDDGRITSRGHARKGEYSTRRILYQDIPTPFYIREQIASLVRLHGLPLWLMERTDPRKVLLEASLRVEMKLLADLAKADVLGRICSDQQDLLDRIDFFAAYCEEQGCWNGKRSFPSVLSRFHYFNREDASPDYEPFDDCRSEVVMLSGLPGMGKDHYLKKNYADWQVVSLDNIRREHKLNPDDTSATGWAVQLAKEQAKVLLRRGQSFVWNATNITRQMRSQWIDLFVAYKAKVKIVYVEVPYKEWLKQNSKREEVVPEAVLLRLLDKLEIPLLSEAHEVEYEIK